MLPWIDGFTAYVWPGMEIRNAKGNWIAFFDVVSTWYVSRTYRGQEERFESIRVTIDGTTYYGRHCLDTPEIKLKPYTREKSQL